MNHVIRMSLKEQMKLLSFKSPDPDIEEEYKRVVGCIEAAANKGLFSTTVEVDFYIETIAKRLRHEEFEVTLYKTKLFIEWLI